LLVVLLVLMVLLVLVVLVVLLLPLPAICHTIAGHHCVPVLFPQPSFLTEIHLTTEAAGPFIKDAALCPGVPLGRQRPYRPLGR
jgi:hypothetical protein